VGKRSGSYPRVRADGAGKGVVSRAGGALLTATIRAAGLDADPHSPWQRGTRMTTVLMPLNRRMSQIITTHADLIEEDHMPAELIALCAHVESYGALQARWEAGRFERYLPHILFPDVVIEYALRHFNRLKSEQARLLGRRAVLSWRTSSQRCLLGWGLGRSSGRSTRMTTSGMPSSTRPASSWGRNRHGSAAPPRDQVA